MFGFGGGGGGGFGIAGGLSLLGGAFLQYQAQKEAEKEQKKADRARQEQLRAGQKIAQINTQRDVAKLKQEKETQLGAMRARLAGQGVDMSGGTGRFILDLTKKRFKEDEEDTGKIGGLEQKAYNSAITEYGRSKSSGMSKYLTPAVSLLGGIGKYQ